ncbi:MAG: DUF3846 domain-containing protein [Roseburia sp.]|nr:DUF3846 domain-containing protein [Roseburia sp.]MCM1096749.1 DUF3846 domain-containing protein [Ruminococcus flavefaciens]MCM1222771.1 DUF3846 domain-containing protein [Lachnospiraceae bacterium]
MDQRMEVLIVEPGKTPRSEMLGSTLGAVEEALGGRVQLGCFLPQRVMLVSRQDGAGLAPNRCLPGKKEAIRGAFLLCGIPGEGSRFVSLTRGQREEFQAVFASPGEFLEMDGVFYADPDDAADAIYRLWETLGDGGSVTLTKYGTPPGRQ